MDDRNAEISICSLVPGATEILCALGLEPNIIGVSELCNYPESINTKPIVSKSRVPTEGYTSSQVETKMRAILDLGEVPYEIDEYWFKKNQPDLIVTQDNCHICEIDVQYIESRMSSFGYKPEILVIDPKSISDIYESVRDLARATHTNERGEMLISDFETRISNILEDLDFRDATKVISIEGVDPLVLGGNWIPEMYRTLGCNYGVLNPGESAARIRIEEIIEFNPDFIFVDLCSSSLERQVNEINWLFEQNGFLNMDAIKNKKLYILNHVFFSTPGPRIVDGMELIANILSGRTENLPPSAGLRICNIPPKQVGMNDYVGLV